MHTGWFHLGPPHSSLGLRLAIENPGLSFGEAVVVENKFSGCSSTLPRAP